MVYYYFELYRILYLADTKIKLISRKLSFNSLTSEIKDKKFYVLNYILYLYFIKVYRLLYDWLYKKNITAICNISNSESLIRHIFRKNICGCSEM